MARRIALVLCLLAGLAATVAASPSAEQQAAIENIVKLVERGVSDQVIIRHLQARHYVFDLSTEDILSLRDQGVSDAVLTAMLDTAVNDAADSDVGVIDNTQALSDVGVAPLDDEDGSEAAINLSAGYYSPWYQYPYAWGSYYDPFPAWYSAYYYPPFCFSFSWGWYGNCGYWYSGYWPGYGWCDPYYYDYACAHHGGCWVPVPHSGDAQRWDAGRGVGNDRGAPGQQVGNSGTARRATSTAAPRNGMRTPQLESRSANSRAHVRLPGRSATPAASPSTRSRGGAPAARPSSGSRYSTPQGGRRSAPASAPRASAPRLDSGGRGASPAQAPRSAPHSVGSSLRSAPSLQVPHAAPSAARSGFSAPRSAPSAPRSAPAPSRLR